MKKIICLFSVLISLSNAAVTIGGGQIGELRNSSGSIISVGSIGVLVADLSNNGILNAYQTSLSSGQFVGGGSDDLILGVYNAVDFGSGAVGFDFSGTSWSYSGSFNQNDNLYFLWFPTISSAPSIVGASVQYGQFRSDTIDASSDIAWIAPADGTYNLVSVSSGLGGSPAVSQAAFTAGLTTSAIPEPTTYAALFGAASLGFCIWRKRRTAA